MNLLFTRRWIAATLFVVIAGAAMVRLGVWQLDRLQQRRDLNDRVSMQIHAEPLDLNSLLEENKSAEMENMEFRRVIARGTFDYSNELALHNQVYQGSLGVHLLTPLRLTGTHQSIVVDRGWIPMDDFRSGKTSQYQEPGTVMLQGRLVNSVENGTIWQKADPTAAPGEHLSSLIYPNISRMTAQSSYPLLPVYIEASPSSDHNGLPYRLNEEIILTEGSHLSYAIQWFAFSAILLIGYPIYIHRSEQHQHIQSKKTSGYGNSQRVDGQHEA